jgi:hypothetical protein
MVNDLFDFLNPGYIHRRTETDLRRCNATRIPSRIKSNASQTATRNSQRAMERCITINQAQRKTRLAATHISNGTNISSKYQPDRITTHDHDEIAEYYLQGGDEITQPTPRHGIETLPAPRKPDPTKMRRRHDSTEQISLLLVLLDSTPINRSRRRRRRRGKYC